MPHRQSRSITAGLIAAKGLISSCNCPILGLMFNIKGNEYRLVVSISYKLQIVYIKFVGTHIEYEKIDAESVDQS